MTAPADRVQVLKQEGTAGGGDDADNEEGFPVPLDPHEDAPEVQGIFFQEPSPSTSLDEEAYIKRNSSGDMIFKDENADSGDEVTLTDLLTGIGGGITESEHRDLDQLVHDIAEDSFTEVEATGSTVTAVRTYTDGTKTTKIREEEYTYTTGKVTTIVTKQYDAAGTLVETYTETVAYTGALVDTITGVLT